MRILPAHVFCVVLCLVVLFLCVPSSLISQPMWGEEGEGIFPVELTGQIYVGGIKNLANGNKAMTVYRYHFVPGPTGDRIVEIEIDQDLEVVHSIQYPAVCYHRGFSGSVELEDGGRITSHENAHNYAMVVRLDNRGQVEWVYESNFIGYAGWGQTTARVYRVADYVLFLHQHPGGILQLEWIDLESGEAEQIIEVTEYPVHGFRTKTINDSEVHIATAWLTEDSTYFKEFITFPGDTLYDERTLHVVETIDTYYPAEIYSPNFLFCLLYSTDPNNSQKVILYDLDANCIDSTDLGNENKVIKSGFYEDGMYVDAQDEVRYYSVSEEGFNFEYAINNLEAEVVVPLDNGTRLFQHYTHHDISCVNAQNQILWTNDMSERLYLFIARGYQNNNEYVLFASDNDTLTSYSYSIDNGLYLSRNVDYLEWNPGKIIQSSMIPATDENIYTVWMQEMLDGPRIDSLHVAMVDEYGVSIPDHRYTRRRNGHNYHTFAATSDDGLWILGDGIQIQLNNQLEEVAVNEGEQIEGDVVYFKPGETEAPHPLLQVVEAQPDRFELLHLEDDGTFDHPPSVLFTRENLHGSVVELHQEDSTLYYAAAAGSQRAFMGVGAVNIINENHDTFVIDSTGYPIGLTKTDSVIHMYYVGYDSLGQTPSYCAPLFHYQKNILSGEELTVTLLDSVLGLRELYWYNNPGNRAVMADITFFDDGMVVLYEGASDSLWRIAKYGFNDELLAGPRILSGLGSLDSCLALSGTDSTLWVVGPGRVYSLSTDLTFGEGFGDGVPFSSYDNVLYNQYHCVVTPQGDLIIGGLPSQQYYHVQRFSPGFLNDTPAKERQQLPSTFTLSTPWPNPFNSVTRLQYELPRAGDVRLTVYDVLGREVRRLVQEAKPAGRHEVLWDATGTSGREVASGIYFIRAELGEQQVVRKVTLVR